MIAYIASRQSDYLKGDFSTSKFFCFSLVIGDFTTYENQALSLISSIVPCRVTAMLNQMQSILI